MARVSEGVDIKRPADRVFTFTTEAKSWPKWQSIIPASEQTSDGPVGIGTTFRGTVHMMGLSMKWTSRATEYEPPKKFGKVITTAAMINNQHNTYESIDGGTRFTILYDMKVRGIFKLLSSMIVSTMQKELKKSLGNLKNVLEAQP